MASPCVSRSTRSRRSAAFGIALALGACSPASSVVGHQPAPPANPSISSTPSAPRPARSAERQTRVERGTLEAIVSDASGRRRAEIAVRIRAHDGTTLRRVTDERGVVRERLAPGYYRVTVGTGCHGRMQITFGGSGRVSITPGAIVRAPVRVEAVRRYAAGPPLLRSHEPPWARGSAIDLRFRLYDRCTDRIMRSFAFDDLEYRPSGHLVVVNAFTRRSDADGLGRVRVRCVRPGPATLILGDPANPNDGEDLLAFTPPLDPNAEWCA